MGVRSFLVHVAPGSREAVTRTLRDEPACVVYPAETHDVLVVVSDHVDRAGEEAFDARLADMPGVLSVALVAGFDDNEAP
jgi:nitrate reductase NapAB chaperone NapD